MPRTPEHPNTGTVEATVSASAHAPIRHDRFAKSIPPGDACRLAREGLRQRQREEMGQERCQVER